MNATKTTASELDILILGNSHFKMFREDRVRGLKMRREAVFTIRGAQDLVGKLKSVLKAIIVHLITNDVKTGSVGECAREMKKLVQQIRQEVGCSVYVSLGIPVWDYRLNKKIQAINEILKVSPHIETINHHQSFHYKGRVIYSLYIDETHQNMEGLKRIVLNCKRAVSPRTNNSTKYH